MKTWVATVATLFALIASNCATAQSAKQFWRPAKGGVVLGQGFSLINGNLIDNTNCVAFSPKTFSNISSLEWAITRSSSLTEYVQDGGISAQAAFAGAAAKAGTSATLREMVRRIASSDSVRVSVAMTRKEDAAFDAHIRSTYTVRACGTHYVSRILYGGYFQFEATSNVKADTGASSTSGTMSFNDASGGSAGLALFNSTALTAQLALNGQSFSSAGLSGTPSISASATVGTAADAIQAYIVSSVTAFENRQLNTLTPAAIQLTPYSQASVQGVGADVVEPLMKWVDYLIDVSAAEDHAELYFDGADLTPHSAQTVIGTERARATALVDQGFGKLQTSNTLSSDLIASPPTVPGPGFIKKLDTQSPSNSIVCRAGANDARLVRVTGRWGAGPGQPRNLCENSSSGMFCTSSGAATSFSHALDGPELRVFGVSNGGSMEMHIHDAGDYSDNLPNAITVACLSPFSAARRQEALGTFK